MNLVCVIHVTYKLQTLTLRVINHTSHFVFCVTEFTKEQRVTLTIPMKYKLCISHNNLPAVIIKCLIINTLISLLYYNLVCAIFMVNNTIKDEHHFSLYCGSLSLFCCSLS